MKKPIAITAAALFCVGTIRAAEPENADQKAAEVKAETPGVATKKKGNAGFHSGGSYGSQPTKGSEKKQVSGKAEFPFTGGSAGRGSNGGSTAKGNTGSDGSSQKKAGFIDPSYGRTGSQPTKASKKKKVLQEPENATQQK